MSTPNSNNRYQNSDASSIYGIKQNLNQYLSDFAEIDFTNVIDNNKIYTYTLSGSSEEVTTSWIKSGMYLSTYKTAVVSGSVYPDYLNTNLVSGGYLQQTITQKLRPNTNYTFIVYGSATVSGAIKASVYCPNANQIWNLENTLEVTGASFTLNSVSGGIKQKHIVTFRTNASIVTGPVYVRLQNISSQNVNLNVFDTMVYSSLIELGNLPPHKDLPIQPNIIPGVVYIDSIYNEQGIATNGTPLVSFSYLKDFYTNRKYNFVALNNDFYLHELNYDEPREPLNPLGIKINNDEGTKTFYLRVVNKNLELEEIDKMPVSAVPNPTISDFENGCLYSLHVSGGEVFLKQDAFYPSDTVYQDMSTGLKYIMVVEDANLKIIETDSSCLVNTSTSATFKTLKDLYNGKKYSLNVSGGALVTIEITGSGDYNAFYKVKDYRNNLDYNLIIENGVVNIVEAYNLSLDEMFLRLNYQDTKFDILSNTDQYLDNKIDTSVSGLNSNISTLDNKINTTNLTVNSVSATLKSLIDTNTSNISTLSTSATYVANALNMFTNSFPLSGGAGFNTNGYQKLLGGLIIQWGEGPIVGASNGASINVPFNIPFPTACMCVVLGTVVIAGDYNIAFQIISYNTSQVEVVNQAMAANNTSAYPTYIAIGY